MNNYQKALASIKVKCLIQGNRTVFKFGDVLKKEVDVLQELVEERHAHILHISDGNRFSKVAFRTEKDAQEYAKEKNLSDFRYEQIPFVAEKVTGE